MWSDLMNYDLLKERVKKISSSVEQIGGEMQELIMDRPASREEVNQKEKELGVKLPESFKKALIEFSRSFSLSWSLPDDINTPEEFNEIFSGSFHWGLNLLTKYEEERKEWISSVFSDPTDKNDGIWHNKLAFCEVGNGDYLGFDIKQGTDYPVIYLSHDDGEGHGYKLADNFSELIDNWSRLAFVGCEDWQWLPFVKSADSGLIANGETAECFRMWLNLDI